MRWRIKPVRCTRYRLYPKQRTISLAVLAALSVLAIPAMAQSLVLGGTSIGTNTAVPGLYSADGSTPMNLTIMGVINVGSGAGPALSINAATLGTITNSGTLSSDATGISNNAGGVIGTLTNSGTISGRDNAIVSDNVSSLGTIQNTGIIAGNITNNATRDLVIVGGMLGHYGTLTGYNGAIGAINNLNGNVDLSGWLVLNDNVNINSNSLSLNYLSSGSVLALNNTVTISGNYNQAATTTLLSNVADNAVATGSTSGDSGYGRLVVNGSATIADGATIGLQKVNAYGFAAGQRFVVVQAAALTTNTSALIYGIVGDAGAAVSGSTMIDGAYTDLVLTVNSVSTGPSTPSNPAASPPALPATNPNAINALKGLRAYSGVSNAGLLNLYNAGQALNNGTTSEANKAGEQLSPVAQTHSMQAAMAPTSNILDIVGEHVDGMRLAQSGSLGIATGENTSQYGFWGQAFGGHSSQGTRDQVSGYSSDYGGLLIGLDKAVSDQWRAGGLFSFSNARVNSNGSTSGNTTSVNSYGLFGYAGFTAPRWYANLSAGVVAQRYTESRTIDFTGFSGNTNGSFNGTQWVARGEIGYPLAAGAFTVTPLASLTYSHLRTNGYTETGGNGAALRVGAAHQTSVSSDLGAKLERALSTQYGELVPSLQLSWRHEYDQSKTSVDASYAADPTGETAFSTLGASPVSDSALLTLGMTLLRASNLSITAQYQVQAASGYVSQAGTLRLRQSF